jgi:hypothetical protein
MECNPDVQHDVRFVGNRPESFVEISNDYRISCDGGRELVRRHRPSTDARRRAGSYEVVKRTSGLARVTTRARCKRAAHPARARAAA